MDESVLSSVLDLRHGPGTSTQVRTACQRFLDEHQQAKEYVSLLDILRTEGGQAQGGDRMATKRKRDEKDS